MIYSTEKVLVSFKGEHNQKYNLYLILKISICYVHRPPNWKIFLIGQVTASEFIVIFYLIYANVCKWTAILFAKFVKKSFE